MMTGADSRLLAGIVALAAALLVGCASESDGEPPEKFAEESPAAAVPSPDPDPRRQLLALAERDRAIRDELMARGLENLTPEDVLRQMAVDAENLAALRAFLDEHGWPEAALVGPEGVDAAFLIVQHADPAFQKEMLPLVRASVEKGELAGEALALLTDRVRVAEGEPQLYGTQVSLVEGELVFEPIEDEAGVDGRRAGLGLPPLEEYRRMLEEAYGLEVPPPGS